MNAKNWKRAYHGCILYINDFTYIGRDNQTRNDFRNEVADQWNLLWFCNTSFSFNFYLTTDFPRTTVTSLSEGLRLSKPFVTLASRSGISNEHRYRGYIRLDLRPILHTKLLRCHSRVIEPRISKRISSTILKKSR